MFRLGVRYKMVSADRAPFIEMHYPSEPRQGFIEREQYEKLLSHLPEWLQPILTSAFQTGWRKEEILELKWEHIDMKERQITLLGRMSKNKHARPIYADDIIYNVLKEQRTSLVFQQEFFSFLDRATLLSNSDLNRLKPVIPDDAHPEKRASLHGVVKSHGILCPSDVPAIDALDDISVSETHTI